MIRYSTIKSSIRRAYSTASKTTDYKLKCGLEIHSQLDTTNKLFSLSETSFNQSPNTRISYFDVSLPGTQPTLNPEALLFALKAAKALNCDINTNSTFDRKHYFYGDQPLGYQITQHYSPIAKNGSFKLFKHDGIKQNEKTINIEQIQLEQDTGKSVYFEEVETNESFSKIDLNRANTPLIELVTKPDFEDSEQVKAFIKKFQNLLRYLKVCTGDLETGAMRVDVNLSVNNNHRVEMKNLSTTSAVLHAIKYEYKRQVDLIKQGKSAELIQETRGWDGNKTIRLRTKENSLDYRYFPDPELPAIRLDDTILNDLKGELPELPDAMLNKLMTKPYELKLKDATILTYDLELLDYYLRLFNETTIKNGINNKLPGNWLIHELLGQFSKNNSRFDPNVITVNKLSALLKLISDDKISNSSAKLLLQHIFNNTEDRECKTLEQIIEEYDLEKETNVNENEIVEICKEIIESNMKVVKTLKKKPNGLKFLVGRAMSLTQGKIQAQVFEQKLKELLKL